MAPGHFDEKVDEDVNVTVPDKKPARFFRNKQQGKTETDEGSGTDDKTTGTEAPVSKEVTPVSLAGLFRYV
jgi:hypothetical protein